MTTKTEIHEYTKHARYWLSVIDSIVKKPGSLDDLSDRDKGRLIRAATEASGTAGTIETIFEQEFFLTPGGILYEKVNQA